MMFEAVKWLTAAASLTGVVLNIHHCRYCFALWAVTNAAWTGIDLWHGIFAQAFLQFVYVMLSMYGWVKWRDKSRIS